jgi:hypothetical protein
MTVALGSLVSISPCSNSLVKPTEEQLTIRAMQVDDVPSVFDIERESFNDSSWILRLMNQVFHDSCIRQFSLNISM